MPRNKSEKSDPPVVRADGRKCWYRDGKRHRDDGPAVECANGSKYWYRDGKKEFSDAEEEPTG